MSAISYAEPGHDYYNQPPHETPDYISERGRRLYGAIQSNLVHQAKVDRCGNGTLIFRQDNSMTIIDAEISIARLVEAIELALPMDEG